MLIYLEKVRKKTLFSLFDPIVTEPLELMYIRSVLDEMDMESRIIDSMFDLKQPKDEIPHMVILTGYNVAQDEILERARFWKSMDPEILVMVSGVHAQLNRNVFRRDYVDYIYFSQDFGVFKRFMLSISDGARVENLPGIDINSAEGKWIVGKENPSFYPEETIASRGFFKEHRKKLRYLDKNDLALVKGARGCPYSCNYCYCRNLNGGNHTKADFDIMFREMVELGAKHFWIVDDVLLTDRKSAMDFIDSSARHGFKGKIIGYLRADFVVEHKDLLEDLYGAGLREVIIGFETPDQEELLDYNKKMDKGIYTGTIELLKENNIELTALFMVKPDYGIREFARLWAFIWKNRIEVYTVSIFTPIKGSDDFEAYQELLLAEDPKKFDFLHLVLPSRLPKVIFYPMFYLIHARLLFSKRIWKFIFAR